MLIRKRQLAAKIETAEGIAEALTAAEAKFLVYNPKVSHNTEMFTRDPVRSSFSGMGKIAGKRPADLSFRLELRGSGTKTIDPAWITLLKGCGFESNVLKSIAIGAITGGPFQHGEIITGGTSAGKGRVIFNTATGATKVYYVIVSGTLQTGEVLTGDTSAASATTSGAPVTEGQEYRPISSGVSSLTLGCYEDGVLKMIKGARGNVKFGFKSGEPVMLDFTFQGVEAGITDVALLAAIAHETQKPPSLLSATLLLDAYAARIGEMNIDVNNVLSARDDLNDSRGILSFQITNRNISGGLNPEMVSVATYDFYSKFFGNTEITLALTAGAATGNMFKFYAPRLQLTKVDDEDKNGLQVAKCAFELNGSAAGEDEFSFCQL